MINLAGLFNHLKHITMKPIKKLSAFELEELLRLHYEMRQLVVTYSHVSKLLPTNLTSKTDKYYDRLCKEEGRRRGEMN